MTAYYNEIDPKADALTSLFAVVIQLHKRVEALEAELKQHKESET